MTSIPHVGDHFWPPAHPELDLVIDQITDHTADAIGGLVYLAHDPAGEPCYVLGDDVVGLPEPLPGIDPFA